MAVAQRMTADEFLALGEDPYGSWRELVEGELVVNEPRPRHNRVMTRLLIALGNWTEAVPGRGAVYAPLDVKLDEGNVFAPDLLWYPSGAEPELEAFTSPLPVLAVEIRSPTTWRLDVGAKKRVYERYGLPELWLADTIAAQVLVFRRSRPSAPSFDVALELGDDDVLTSPLLPGFELALRGVFPQVR